MASSRLFPPASSLIRRRIVLGHGIAGLATLMGFSACGDDDVTPSGTGGAGAAGAGGAGAGGRGGGGAGGEGGSGGGTPEGLCREGVTPPRLVSGLTSNLAAIGPLAAEPDANGLFLPTGFTSRVVARTNEPPTTRSTYAWHPAPDGGATYAAPDGGWVYVSNSELPLIGGAGALRFAANGEVIDAYAILTDTQINCAGGRTPWGTWLSCEEAQNGKVFECDPFGRFPAVAHLALGVFKHEAAAIDPVDHKVYLTEDQPDGRFYRFVPQGVGCQGFANLTAGQLEVAEVADNGAVTWHPVPDPQFTGKTPTRLQVPASTAFDGGEGIDWFDGVVYFSTKGNNRVWAYDVASSTLTILYDAATAKNPILTGVDNLTVTCCGDVLVAEDGGDMQIVAILADGTLKPLLQVQGHAGSEITGPAFDPSGTRLYFSSQRGPAGGVTYEVSGPFHLPR